MLCPPPHRRLSAGLSAGLSSGGARTPGAVWSWRERRRLPIQLSCALLPLLVPVTQRQPGAMPKDGSQPSFTGPRLLSAPRGPPGQRPPPALCGERGSPWATLKGPCWQRCGVQTTQGKGGERLFLTSANWWMNILYGVYVFCKWMRRGDKAGRRQEWKIFRKNPDSKITLSRQI